jgi:hypothetical protein
MKTNVDREIKIILLMMITNSHLKQPRLLLPLVKRALLQQPHVFV